MMMMMCQHSWMGIWGLTEESPAQSFPFHMVFFYIMLSSMGWREGRMGGFDKRESTQRE